MRFPTSKRGEGRRAHSRRKFALGAAVCLLALAACLAACAPSTARRTSLRISSGTDAPSYTGR